MKLSCSCMKRIESTSTLKTHRFISARNSIKELIIRNDTALNYIVDDSWNFGFISSSLLIQITFEPEKTV